MSTIFTSTFITHLIPYLSPLDYIMLRRAAPGFFVRGSWRYPSVAEVCLQRCERMLNDTFELEEHVTQSIMTALRSERVVLSGGALLSIIRGEPIDPKIRDFDLYTVQDYKNGGHPDMSWLIPPNSALHVENGGPQYEHLMWEHMEVLEIRFPRNQKANVIMISALETRVEELVANFDFSFCSNVLYGNTLRCLDIDSVLNARCTFQLNCWLRFFPVACDTYEMVRDRLQLRFAKRLEKYRARGYQIDVVTDWRPEVMEPIIRNSGIRISSWNNLRQQFEQLQGESNSDFSKRVVPIIKARQRTMVARWFKQAWEEEITAPK